jgi:hypothetical protein
MRNGTKQRGAYGWVDKNKGVAHIPIPRAMQLTMAELQAKKPMAAGPIATPAPGRSARDCDRRSATDAAAGDRAWRRTSHSAADFDRRSEV